MFKFYYQNISIKENSANKRFYDKCDDPYFNIKNKIIPRNETELYNRRKSKYDNGVVKVILY